jgi:hypothetical protein
MPDTLVERLREHAFADRLMPILNEAADALSAATKKIRAQECQIRNQTDFLHSRQCSDHNGKWERGRCLQCELSAATERERRLRAALEDAAVRFEMADGHRDDAQRIRRILGDGQ